MSFAPNHDYRHYESATAMPRLEAERRATAVQKANRYAELVAIAQGVEKRDLTSELRLQRWLNEKVPMRLRQCFAFSSLDD